MYETTNWTKKEESCSALGLPARNKSKMKKPPPKKKKKIQGHIEIVCFSLFISYKTK